MNSNVTSKTISQLWTDVIPNTANPSIISICKSFYLDHSNTPLQGLPNDWCKSDGVSLEDVYNFSAKKYPNVLGVEAPLWTEFAHNPAEADDRLWPRLVATAEVAWTPELDREINSFRGHLGSIGERLDLMGVSFFATPTVRWSRKARSKEPSSAFFDFVP